MDQLIQYKCNCTKKRMEDGLISLGKKELEDIINTDEKAEIICRFCKEKYNFTKEDLKILKEKCKN